MHVIRGRRLIPIAAALSLFATAAATSATGATKQFDCRDGAITVGVAQAKTGGFAFFDYAGFKGFQIGVDEINRAGGIDGCRLKVIFGDTKSDPALAQQVTQDLIKRGASIIKTPADFDIGVGSSVAARSAKVFSFSAEASSVDWPKAVKTHVVMAITTNDLGSGQALFANRKGWKKAYIVTNEAFNFFQAMERTFRSKFRGTVVGRDVVADDQTDYSAVVSKIRDASNKPDVIYLNDYFPHVGTFMKQLRDAGVNTAVLGNSTYSSPQLAKVVGPARMTNVFYVGQNFYEGPTASPAVRRFVNQYRQRYKSFPENQNTVAAYEGAYLLRNALRAAGSTDADKVLQAMVSQRNVKLPTNATIFSFTNGYTNRDVSVIGYNAKGVTRVVTVIKP